MKMFKTMGLAPHIDEYEVVKITPKKVYYYKDGEIRKQSRSHKYCKWHQSYEEARAHLMKRISNEIDEVESQLDNYEFRWRNGLDAYTKVKNMHQLKLVVNK